MLRHIPYFYFDNSLPRQPFSIAGYIRRGKSDVITRGRCELKRSDFGWILKMFVFCLFFLPALSCSVLHSFHLIQNCFQIQLSAPSFLLPSPPNLYQQRSSCCSASHLGLLWICVNRCTKKEQKNPPKNQNKRHEPERLTPKQRGEVCAVVTTTSGYISASRKPAGASGILLWNF